MGLAVLGWAASFRVHAAGHPRERTESGSRHFQGLVTPRRDPPLRCQLTPGRDQKMKVAEAIRLIERDGWRQIAQRGRHRQFKNQDKPGRVTVAGKPSDDWHPAP